MTVGSMTLKKLDFLHGAIEISKTTQVNRFNRRLSKSFAQYSAINFL